MSRSLSHLLEIVRDLKVRQVDLKSLRENIDTSLATGRAFLSIMGAVSQMELEIKSERAEAGRVDAKARGKSGGRPVSIQTSSNRHASFTRTPISPPERFDPSSDSQSEPSSNTSEKSDKVRIPKARKSQIALQYLKRAITIEKEKSSS